MRKTIIENVNNKLAKDIWYDQTVEEALRERIIGKYRTFLDVAEQMHKQIAGKSCKYLEVFENIATDMTMTILNKIGTFDDTPYNSGNNPLWFMILDENKKEGTFTAFKTQSGFTVRYLQQPVRLILADIILFLILKPDGTQATIEEHIEMIKKVKSNKENTQRGDYAGVKNRKNKIMVELCDSLIEMYEGVLQALQQEE